MKQTFKFTLLANSYSTAKRQYKKPFSIILEEDDPRIAEFRGRPEFKEEPIGPQHVRIPAIVQHQRQVEAASGKAASGPEADSHEDESEEEQGPMEQVFGQEIADILVTGGYDSVEKVAKAADEDLLAVKQVGKGRLKQIREMYEAYIEDESEEE